MKYSFAIGILLSCGWLCVASAQQADQPVAIPKALDEIQAGQRVVHLHLNEARDVKSLTVFSCLDKKAQLIDRIATVTKGLANKPYKTAQKNNDDATLLKLSERVRVATNTVNKLVPQALLCWCEDAEAVGRLSASFLESQGIQADKLCPTGGAEQPDTVVTLKAPESESDITVEERDLETLESGFGFPEIPPASPFR